MILSLLILLSNLGILNVPSQASFGQINDPSMLQLPIDISPDPMLPKQMFDMLSQQQDIKKLHEEQQLGISESKRDSGDEIDGEPNGIKDIKKSSYESEENVNEVDGKTSTISQDESERKNSFGKSGSKGNMEENQTPFKNNQNSQNKQNNIKGPVKLTFVDSYWTNNIAPETVVASISSGQVTAQQMPPVARVEVDAGEGNSVLAVTIINQGFSDISGVKGFFEFPNGFKALVTPDNLDSDTAISTYNGVVRAGQSFVLYFPVNILENTQVGKEYQGDLKIKYFKLTEQTKKDFRTANIEVPFRLSGKVVLELKGADQGSIAPSANGANSISPYERIGIINVLAGSPNNLNIELSNIGSATATGVTVNVLSSNQQVTTNAESVDGLSNSTLQSTQATTQIPFINLGNTVFNVGTLSPNQKFNINPIIFPPISSVNALQNIDIRISFNDAYGNKKTVTHLVGVQIVPAPPQNDLFITPADRESENNIITSSKQPSEFEQINLQKTNPQFKYMNLVGGYSNHLYPVTTLISPPPPETRIQSQNNNQNTVSSRDNQIEVVAGKTADISFNIKGFESLDSDNNVISNLAITITPQSPSVKIIGQSHWNLPTLDAQNNILTTSVFASPSLIGNPIFFTVNVQYLKNYQEIKIANFNLGAVVTGNIQLSINNLDVRPIGNELNLVGNVLNEGNSNAQFSKISIQDTIVDPASKPLYNMTNDESSSPNYTEYLGNLPVDEPVPFNIPLTEQIVLKLFANTQNQTSFQQTNRVSTVMVPLKVTYTDSIQNIHEKMHSIPLTMDRNILSTFGNLYPNNGFVDSYWAVDAPLQSNSASTSSFTKASIQKAVAPGEGSSILAVELTNTGFADISGITGYLKLPSGFQPDSSAPLQSGNKLPPPDTLSTVASNGNVIKPGQTYTLYFKVKVLESATIGSHIGSLSIFYFKVPDAKVGTYRTQEIDFPFFLSGKPILDSTANITDLEPGITNPVKIYINNRGTAAATGTILQISDSDNNVVSDSASEIAVANDTSVNNVQSDSASAPLITTGQSVFNLQTIPVNGHSEVLINVIPSVNAEESFQKLNLHITFNSPVGVTNSVDQTIGFRVLPDPPDGGLSITAGNPGTIENQNDSTADRSNRGTNNLNTILGNIGGIEELLFTNKQADQQQREFIIDRQVDSLNSQLSFISTTETKVNRSISDTLPKQSKQANDSNNETVFITAGKIDDFMFNITNNNNKEIRNAVITLTVNTGSLEILGNSKWSIDRIDPNTTMQFPTKIFASKSLINSPVSFKVNIDYIDNGQLKSDTFNIGASVVGEIDVSINDLGVENIGGVLNVVGNLLNKGNTGGLFTTVEVVTDEKKIDSEINRLLMTGLNVTNLSIVTPLATTPQYLGDIEEDSPLPFNIPLSTSNKSASGNYLVPLKIEYYDDLRNLYTVHFSEIISIELPSQNVTENQGLSSLFFIFNPIGLLLIIIIIVIIFLIIKLLKKRKKSKKQRSKKYADNKNSFIDLLDSVKKGEIDSKKYDQ